MAFIGRERELAVLGSALQRAAEGEPTRVSVSGPLGIGISRLIDEVADRLRGANGITLYRARCFAPRSGLPYGAIRFALAEILAQVPDDELAAVLGQASFDLAALIPELRPRLANVGAAPLAPGLDAADQRGARMRESLIGVIGRLAARSPLCLVIEDLEHSDPGTREFVSVLLRLSRRLPLALIVTHHIDELPRTHPALELVREISESQVVEKLSLAPLMRDELFELVESLREEKPTLGFVAAVLEGSHGSPLIAIQLVEAHGKVAGLRLSDPFEEILHARVGLLDQQQQRSLGVLAAARRPITEEQLSRVKLPDGHLPRNAVASALESGLAIATDDGFAVIHELCAEVIEQSLIPAERRAVHAALAVLPGIEPAEAAWHRDRSGRISEAREVHIAAAHAAEQLDPGGAAFMHYSVALELADETTDVSLLSAAASAAAAAGAFRRAATLAEQAISREAGGRVERLLGSAGTKQKRNVAGSLTEQLGRYRRASGDATAARQAFEQALELIPTDSRALRARAMASLAQDLMLEGRFADSATLAEKARAEATSAGADALADFAHATDTLAVDLGYLGEIDRGLSLLDEAMATARKVGRLDEVMRCYANRTTLLDLDSRREQALAAVKEGIAEADRSGLGLTYGAFLRGNAADILYQLGRWDESEAECRAAMEFPPAGVAWFSPTLYLGLVLVESRADEEAGRLVGQTLLQLETVPSGQWSALVLRTAVSVALWRGELADARSAAQQGWERVLETKDPAQVFSAAATVMEVCAASAEHGRLRRDWSEVADAGALAGQVLPIAEEYLARQQLPERVGARRESELYLATARAHGERVRGRDKPETWAGLAEAWSKIPVPYQVAKARWWQAQAALPTRARRAEARKALTEAWRIATDLPAQPLRDALRDLGARSRIALPDGDAPAVPVHAEAKDLVPMGPGRPQAIADLAARIAGPTQTQAESRFGLSPRENSVLLVLTEGRTNREIAERLFISERTVAVHVRRILAKMGVGGRTEAAGLAIRLGLVPDETPDASAGRSARI